MRINNYFLKWILMRTKRNNLYYPSLSLFRFRKRQSISSHVVVNWWLLAHEVLINFILILEGTKRVDNWAFPFWFRLLALIQNLEQKQLELKVCESNRYNIRWTMRRGLSIISKNKNLFYPYILLSTNTRHMLKETLNVFNSRLYCCY